MSFVPGESLSNIIKYISEIHILLLVKWTKLLFCFVRGIAFHWSSANWNLHRRNQGLPPDCEGFFTKCSITEIFAVFIQFSVNFTGAVNQISGSYFSDIASQCGSNQTNGGSLVCLRGIWPVIFEKLEYWLYFNVNQLIPSWSRFETSTNFPTQ